MTPKEKAEQLIAKYTTMVNVSFIEDSIPTVIKGLMLSKSAKQCALIAVDEIIYNISGLEDSVWYNNASGFWQEVKQEIEKL